MLLVLAIAAFILALLPAALFAANVPLFRPLPQAPEGGQADSGPLVLSPISVLIPARNEEPSIVAAVESILANRGVDIEVIVLDDHSEDATAALVRQLAARDARLRLESAPALPPGWCGKQHACHRLASHARHDLFCWMDADVRLAPDALRRISAWMSAHPDVGLLSGFPRQQTQTFLERLLIPLIHFVLLAFLPLARMRASKDPSLGAGCGQLFIARRAAYVQAGGHSAIASSRHDGLMLPRAFRKAAIATDLFDATDAASCRMYHSSADTWKGLAKNATEGMAAPRAILFWTLLLGLGQILPLFLLFHAIAAQPHQVAIRVLAVGALLLSLSVRLTAALRYSQTVAIALFHPLAILTLLTLQWHALALQFLGKSPAWKGRTLSVHPS